MEGCPLPAHSAAELCALEIHCNGSSAAGMLRQSIGKPHHFRDALPPQRPFRYTYFHWSAQGGRLD